MGVEFPDLYVISLYIRMHVLANYRSKRYVIITFYFEPFGHVRAVVIDTARVVDVAITSIVRSQINVYFARRYVF